MRNTKFPFDPFSPGIRGPFRLLGLLLGLFLLAGCGGGGGGGGGGGSSESSPTPQDPGVVSGPVTFRAQDLAGTWRILALGLSPDQGHQHHGALSFNTAGALLDGSWATDQEPETAVASGTLALTAAGQLSGQWQTAGGATLSVVAGAMFKGKDALFLNLATLGPESLLAVALKAPEGGNLSSSSLHQAWTIFEIFSSGSESGFRVGELACQDGALSGSLTSESGTPLALSSGSLSLSGDGILTGTWSEASAGLTAWTHGAFSTRGDLFVLSGRTGLPAPALVLGVRKATSSSPALLAGTWNFGTVSYGQSGRHTETGTLVLSASGTLTGGTWSGEDGSSWAITSGTYTSPVPGRLSGTWSAADGHNFLATEGVLRSSGELSVLLVTQEAPVASLLLGRLEP